MPDRKLGSLIQNQHQSREQKNRGAAKKWWPVIHTENLLRLAWDGFGRGGFTAVVCRHHRQGGNVFGIHLLFEEHDGEQQNHANGHAGVGNIENRPAGIANAEIQKVNNLAIGKAVDEISHGSAKDDRQ